MISYVDFIYISLMISTIQCIFMCPLCIFGKVSFQNFLAHFSLFAFVVYFLIIGYGECFLYSKWSTFGRYFPLNLWLVFSFSWKYLSRVPWWFSGLRIQHCHCFGTCCCCGVCSIPALWVWQKKKKNDQKPKKTTMKESIFQRANFYNWWRSINQLFPLF